VALLLLALGGFVRLQPKANVPLVRWLKLFCAVGFFNEFIFWGGFRSGVGSCPKKSQNCSFKARQSKVARSPIELHITFGGLKKWRINDTSVSDYTNVNKKHKRLYFQFTRHFI
jgi:hypothetical protein